MPIKVEADDTQPFGGHARLEIQSGREGWSETSLTIIRLEDDQFLGESGWRGASALLGPFPLETGPNGVRVLRLGPPYTNFLEPFQRVRIDAPELSATATLSWPEEIDSAPLGATSGGIFQPKQPGNLSNPVAPMPPKPPLTTLETPKKRSTWWVSLLALAACTAMAAILVPQFLSQEKPTEDLVEGQLDPTSTSCELGVVANATPERIFETAIACEIDGDRDRMVELVERAALEGFGPAFLQKAKWYDPTQEAASPIQPNIGFAVRNYHDALNAGVSEAGPLLESACANLSAENGDLAQMIFDNSCSDQVAH